MRASAHIVTLKDTRCIRPPPAAGDGGQHAAPKAPPAPASLSAARRIWLPTWHRKRQAPLSSLRFYPRPVSGTTDCAPFHVVEASSIKAQPLLGTEVICGKWMTSRLDKGSFSRISNPVRAAFSPTWAVASLQVRSLSCAAKPDPDIEHHTDDQRDQGRKTRGHGKARLVFGKEDADQ